MSNAIEIENLRAVFNRVMQSHQLKPQEVKKKYSCIECPGLGKFTCVNCIYEWISNFSWARFDLMNLEVVYRWKMKCKFCHALYSPFFSEEQLESMFKRVVIYYKGENTSPSVDIGYRARRIYRQPHLPDLCEKCDWGQNLCWTRKIHYS